MDSPIWVPSSWRETSPAYLSRRERTSATADGFFCSRTLRVTVSTSASDNRNHRIGGDLRFPERLAYPLGDELRKFGIQL
jgi:hypothetical protein